MTFLYGHRFGDQIVTKRVIVCGTRKWHDRKLVADTLHELVVTNGWRFPDPVIVHGAARGADRIADDEAGKAGLVVEPHPADWDGLGKKAGLVRNGEMAALGADLCIAFWDGRSTGTAHMIDAAERHGIPVQIVEPVPSKTERVGQSTAIDTTMLGAVARAGVTRKG